MPSQGGGAGRHLREPAGEGLGPGQGRRSLDARGHTDDDVVIRVAAGVEGAAALARAETFASRLSQMTARAASL